MHEKKAGETPSPAAVVLIYAELAERLGIGREAGLFSSGWHVQHSVCRDELDHYILRPLWRTESPWVMA